MNTTKITFEITIASNDDSVVNFETISALEDILHKVKQGYDSGYESRNHNEGNDDFTEYKFVTNITPDSKPTKPTSQIIKEIR